MPLFRQVRQLTLEEADERFAAAERRVGWALYHTECPKCDACEGIRVLVEEFRPSRSQRRVMKRWAALGQRVRVEVGPVTWSDEKLHLYNRHKSERGLAQEEGPEMDVMGYVGWLMRSCFQTMEMRYYLDDRLIGVGICDVGRRAMSSVYFYFDPSPEIAKLSPGVFSVLKEIELCRRTDRPHHYLGLFVGDCSQLNYKAAYRPHERRIKGKWCRFDRQSPPAQPA